MELESISKYLTLEEKSEDSYDFPAFYFSFPESRYYFKPISLDVGRLNLVVANSDVGKTLFFNALTGLAKPNELPKDRSFLKYDIVYKKEEVNPKFEGTLEELIFSKGLLDFEYYKIFENIFSKYKNIKVKELSEKVKQYLSFVLLLNKEGLIYIFDYKYDIISTKMRQKMWTIFQDFCNKNDKIGLVPEIENSMSDCGIYNIKKIGENEYFGFQ